MEKGGGGGGAAGAGEGGARGETLARKAQERACARPTPKGGGGVVPGSACTTLGRTPFFRPAEPGG